MNIMMMMMMMYRVHVVCYVEQIKTGRGRKGRIGQAHFNLLKRVPGTALGNELGSELRTKLDASLGSRLGTEVGTVPP
jgi:hypothetical protein